MNAYYGYYFHSRAYHHAPGYPRLDIFIKEIPTDEHFDPEEVELLVQSSDDPPTVEQLTVAYPWAQEAAYTVCAGRIKLRDRKGKLVEAFTFGGKLHIHEHPGLVECQVESPAPILDVASGATTAVTLAEETEIIFAGRRAAWPDDADFDARLAVVPPQVLYTACLEALQARFNEMPHQGLPQVTQFLSFLRAEMAVLQDQNLWPGIVPALDEIL